MTCGQTTLRHLVPPWQHFSSLTSTNKGDWNGAGKDVDIIIQSTVSSVQSHHAMKQSPMFWQNNHHRPQFSSVLACSTSHSCVSLVSFRVSHDNSEIKIAQLMAVIQPINQLSQTLVYHLKARNVKASIRP